jgi:hypothetical protein
MWPMFTSMTQPDLFKQLSGSHSGIARGNACQERGHGNILLCGEGGEQIKILEDVPKEGPPIARKALFVLKVYLLSRNGYPPAARGHYQPSY